jgi:predicted RNA-binding Zn ribbon-like protein
MDNYSELNTIRGNRLCLDFVNLPYRSGDPVRHVTSWEELIEFLVEKQVVSAERSEQLEGLPEADPAGADNLLHLAERLAEGIRFALRSLVRDGRVHREWIEPINEVLRVTEGHDELERSGDGWRLAFLAKNEGLDWLLAAIARSAAELIAAGPKSGIRQCGNPSCELLFCDDSRTHRRRWCSMALCGNRNKVAAFARRHGTEKARAQHA